MARTYDHEHVLPSYKYRVGDQFMINGNPASIVELHAVFTRDTDPGVGVPAYHCSLANIPLAQLLPQMTMLDGHRFGFRAAEKDDSASSDSSAMSSASVAMDRNQAATVIANYSFTHSTKPSAVQWRMGQSRDQWTEIASDLRRISSGERPVAGGHRSGAGGCEESQRGRAGTARATRFDREHMEGYNIIVVVITHSLLTCDHIPCLASPHPAPVRTPNGSRVPRSRLITQL
jgi:hypothetical protein